MYKFMPALDEAIKTFNDARIEITSKNYDYLNQRNGDFDKDFDIFITKTNALKESVACTIEENFADIWETRHGYKFLIRFEKVKLLLTIQIFN